MASTTPIVPADVDQGSSSRPVNNIKRGSKHACERCRKSKLRCLLDTVEQSGKCRRCLETSSSCVFLPAAPRQRRRRTDARVSSLEKELEEMKALVRQLQGTRLKSGKETSGPSTKNTRKDKGSKPHDSPNNPLSPSSTNTTSADLEHPGSGSANSSADIIPGTLSSDLMSKEQAIELFQSFVQYYSPLHPAVYINESDDFEDLKYSRPILLLAAIAAASGSGDPNLFETLSAHLRTILVNQVFIEGRKSLEIIQAILLFVFWYCPPNDLKTLSFYQWIHIAGTMAVQLGIDWRQRKPAIEALAEPADVTASDAQMEVWRTMFAVWESCSSVAISLQRRPLVEYPAAAHKSLEAYERNATLMHDKRLIAWVKVELISQEIETLKNDFMIKKESGLLGSTSTHIATADLERRFMEWESALEPGILNEPLIIHHYYCRIKLHELAMHQDSNLDELLPPYLPQPTSSSKKRHNITDINPSYVRALLSLVNACHSTLDALLATDIHVLRRVPTVTLVRGVYTIKALSMIREASGRSDSDISKVIDEDDLRFDFYVNAIINHYGAVSGDIQRRTSMKIRAIVQRIAAFQQMSHSTNKHRPIKPNIISHEPDCSGPPDTILMPARSETQEIQFDPSNTTFAPNMNMFEFPGQTDSLWNAGSMDMNGFEDGLFESVNQPDPHFHYFYSNDYYETPRNTLQDFAQLTTPNIPFNATDSFNHQS